jgi:hypothetical protein
MKLPIKQERFVENYITNGGNSAKAYRDAGYKSTQFAAEANASRLLSNDRVSRAIAERRAALRKVADVTAQEVIATLASFMRGNVIDLLDAKGDFNVAHIREKKLGHLLRSVTIRREKSELRLDKKNRKRRIDIDVIRVEIEPKLGAANQLCKVLGIEQKKGANENDPERLKALLDERVAFAIEGFKRGGVKLSRKDVIEMFSESPHSAGDLYPLIQEELASVH